jgi:propanol-preferring alcohol dehydrogenase
MVLERVSDFSEEPNPLRLLELPVPEPGHRDVLLRIRACGVCHTELDEIEGRTPPSVFPMVLGHQVVGSVVAKGRGVEDLQIGDRVGVGWIFSSCGRCRHCLEGEENLCPDFRATGRDAPGGYAQYMTVDERFAFRIPEVFSDAEAAPLFCAGAIGYRSLRLSRLGKGARLGLTGFGASAHLVMKMISFTDPEARVYVFARSERERAFALELGAVWAGDTAQMAPDPLDSIIDTTPVWGPVVEALKNLRPGGRLVINAIRKEDADKERLLSLKYERDLWQEKEIKSVANVARRDISEFLSLAARMFIKPEIELFPLSAANRALRELKERRIRGAKVLVMDQDD